MAGQSATNPLPSGDDQTRFDAITQAPGTPAGRIARQLVDEIGERKFDTWFSQTQLRVDGRLLEVATDSQFIANWIGSHYGEVLRTIVNDALGDEARFDVRVAPDLFGRNHASRDGADDALRDGDASRDGPPRLSRTTTGGRPGPRSDRAGHAGHAGRDRLATLRRLDEFIVGSSNRLAYSAAARLAEEVEPRAVSPLFIHGECGVGKTHLLQGICRKHADRSGRPGALRYVTGEQFTNEFITAVRNGTLDDFRRRMRKLELLAIDDVHFLSNKVRTQNEFLHTLDAIDLTGARVVLASDGHPRQIRRFSQALVSRFLSGMVVQVDRPDRETRVELTRRLVDGRGLELSAMAMDTIADRCVGSVRELEGAITKLAALHALTPVGIAGEREIGMALVDQLFRDDLWRPAAPVRVGTVMDQVCRRLGVERGELIGSGRHRRVVLARGLIAHLARELTTHSYPEIATAMGRTYHSTVHSAARRLKRQMEDGETVDVGGDRCLTLRELTEQLRHEILRDSTRGDGRLAAG